VTVIAVRGGIMAADTALWQGGIIAGHAQKIVRLSNNQLVACSGERPAALACIQWLSQNGTKPDPIEDGRFGGLILGASGIQRISPRFEIYESGDEEFAAEGAHIEFLLGAMHAGATAEEAVRLAIQCGDSAGGDVQVEHL